MIVFRTRRGMNVALAVFCFVPALASAMPDYGQELSPAGTNISAKDVDKKLASPEQQNGFLTLPIEKWVGERFVFMPADKSFQRFGYQYIRRQDQEEYASTVYSELVGKTAKVLSVREKYKDGPFNVELQLEDSQTIYIARSIDRTVGGLCPLRDIETAKKKLVGQSYWYLHRELPKYREDQESPAWQIVPKYSKVFVKNVIPSTKDFQPIRLIVKTVGGIEGYVDVSLSGTNNGKDAPSTWGLLVNDLTDVNMRKLYPWSPKVWSAIEAESILIGMTPRQVRMSWGEPTQINRTQTAFSEEEQWVFEDTTKSRYVYFRYGRVCAIQQ